MFSDVKRDINKGYPVLMLANSHMYVIIGYSEGGSNGNLLYVSTGWTSPDDFMWITVGNTINAGSMGSINIY